MTESETGWTAARERRREETAINSLIVRKKRIGICPERCTGDFRPLTGKDEERTLKEYETLVTLV